MTTSAHRWTLVVPVKAGPAAKSRLAYAARPALAEAMVTDTLWAAIASPKVERIILVTSDPSLFQRLTAGFEPDTVTLVTDPGGGLDAAAAEGVRIAQERSSHVAVLLGDHPSLRPGELDLALDGAAPHTTAFIPDAEGSGTAMATTTIPGALATAFGPGSAARHQALGMERLDIDAPGLRQDVDDLTDLDRALDIGVGERTRGALRS